MPGKNAKIFAILFILFFSLTASAKDFAVSIEARDNNGIQPLYQDEIVYYLVKAVNFGATEITALNVEVSAEKDLAIIDNAAEKQNQRFVIEKLKPGTVFVKEFLVKAKAEKSEKAIISAAYGFTSFDNVTTSFARIIPNKTYVGVKAKKNPFSQGEENALLLSISNNSSKDISDIQAQLVLPADFETDANIFSLPVLASDKKIQDEEFGFRAKELANGKRRIVLLVSFTDENGKHTLDKAVNVDVAGQTLPIFLAVIVIALISFAAFFLKPSEIPDVFKKTAETKPQPVEKKAP